MRCSRSLAVPVMVLIANLACLAALAQTPDYSNLGRTPSQEEIRAWDIAVGLEGKELPPGSGTAQQGAEVYAKKCQSCHGQNLDGEVYQGGKVPPLVGGKGTLTSSSPVKTVGSYWPFATTVWDFINRAMPRWQERTLTPDEVYAVTAFILYKNDIIKENDVLDAKTLPKVQMPNRDGFLPRRLEDIHDFKKRGCRLGHCPDK
jgi:S-disulfanyl-L-cysteine oxidoreductase SoxD